MACKHFGRFELLGDRGAAGISGNTVAVQVHRGRKEAACAVAVVLR
jgi:hypothetical protein